MKTNNKRFPKNRILIHNLAWKGRVIWKSRQNIKLSKWNENVLDVGLKPKPTMLPGKCLDVTFYDSFCNFSARMVDTAMVLLLWYTWSEQHKVLQRSSAAASWARALWAERGCCTQIRRAIGSLREQERARGSQREQESKPERARERLASHLKHASTLFCCKTVKYNSVLSQNVKIRYFLSRNVKIRAMSGKNGINCDASWLRILCCSAGEEGSLKVERQV